MISDMKKIYDDSKRYNGDEYDPLDLKLRTFYERCNIMGIHPTQKQKVFEVLLLGKASEFYYINLAPNQSIISPRTFTYEEMIQMLKSHFQTDERRQNYLLEWEKKNFFVTEMENPGKTKREVLELLFTRLQKLAQCLGDGYYNKDNVMRNKLLNACGDVPECNLAIFKPASSFEGLCADLRSSISTAMRTQQARQYNAENDDQFWTDRVYVRRGKSIGRGRNPQKFSAGASQSRFQPPDQRLNSSFSRRSNGIKKCFICKKVGCWSTNHSDEERRQSYNSFSVTV